MAESIANHLQECINEPTEKRDKEIDYDIQKLKEILNTQLSGLIEDIAKNPKHTRVWRRIASSIGQVEPAEYRTIRARVAQLIHLGSFHSKPVQKQINILENNIGVTEMNFQEIATQKKIFKHAGLILLNAIKLFRGAIPLTEEQKSQLHSILVNLKYDLSTLKQNYPEIKDHPNFNNLEKLNIDFLDNFLVSLKEKKNFDTKFINLLSHPLLPLDPNDPQSHKKNLALIREAIAMNPQQGFRILAAYLDNNKIPLAKAKEWLSTEEFHSIQPYIKYVDFRGFSFDHWTSKEIFEFIKNCKNIETLIISTNKLQALPEMPQLTALDCHGCTALAALPALPALTRLICWNCPALAQLGQMDALQELVCLDCITLAALPALPALTRLNCSDCPALAQLGQMDALQSLDCHGCTALGPAPPCLLLIRLNCADCPALAQLGQMDALQELDCTGCTTLAALPALPALTRLICWNCPALAQLGQMDALQELDCHGCTTLAALPALPALTRLDCYR